MKRTVALFMVLMLFIPILLSPSLAFADNQLVTCTVDAVPQGEQPTDFWWCWLRLYYLIRFGLDIDTGEFTNLPD